MSELDVRLNIRVLFKKGAGTGLVTYHDMWLDLIQ